MIRHGEHVYRMHAIPRVPCLGVAVSLATFSADAHAAAPVPAREAALTGFMPKVVTARPAKIGPE